MDAENVAAPPDDPTDPRSRLRTSRPDTNGHGPPDAEPARHLHLEPLDRLTLRATLWTWADRIPIGELTLLAGREGIGKSICANDIAAALTRGTLPGQYHGTPRNVAIAASEDSWERTIGPRLVAAGADMARVHRVKATTPLGVTTQMILPEDLDGLATLVEDKQIVLLLLDPFLPRLNNRLDTHKDGEVRQGLEPLAQLAHDHALAVVGLIHVNKSGSADALTSVMASRAFVAVARSVLFAIIDPADPTSNNRLLCLAKANLGRLDTPSINYHIEGRHLGQDPDGYDIWAGKVIWAGETARNIAELIAESGAGSGQATREAKEWLEEYMTDRGGGDMSADIKRAGSREGHSKDSLDRAKKALKVEVTSRGFPRRTHWALPGTVTTEGN